jgi:hypothetical protein
MAAIWDTMPLMTTENVDMMRLTTSLAMQKDASSTQIRHLRLANA